jgi:hypothetical protein
LEGVPDPATQINVDPCGSGSRSTTLSGTRTLTASGSVIHNYESCSRSRRPLYYRSTAQIISLKANRRQQGSTGRKKAQSCSRYTEETQVLFQNSKVIILFIVVLHTEIN